ncbi:MAG: hypothetical protein HC770_12085 [Pseudanabaena sp. CRU_2_10]|nr:hypothetical protein [Pseudanabaena sp. CRU_2_10]
MAAGWLLLYGINAYWLTAVHNTKFGRKERPRGRTIGKNNVLWRCQHEEASKKQKRFCLSDRN